MYKLLFNIVKLLWLLVIFRRKVDCILTNSDDIEKYQKEVDSWLNEVNSNYSKLNFIASIVTWAAQAANKPIMTHEETKRLNIERDGWKSSICNTPVQQHLLKPDQRRKLYLLCRGPRLSPEYSSGYMEALGEFQFSYNDDICFSSEEANAFNALNEKNHIINNQLINTKRCVTGEPDLERIMKRTDLNSEQLKWVWLKWHNLVGPKIKADYPSFVHLQNLAAQSNGYSDMGQIWREELEIPNLDTFVTKLYEEIKPLYMLLHAVVRHKLVLKYGSSVVDPEGLIPIHLLGNMWAQDWSPLVDLFISSDQRMSLEENLSKRNWTVIDMLLKAEDMFTSLGLPKMTEKFWKNSIFEQSPDTPVCHGSATSMFAKDDYRVLLCSEVTMDDLYTINHEMGHIEYYMAYKDQPIVFQEGANSAFHESVGDAIMHAAMTPQHLHRLHLISDETLFDNEIDLFLLLFTALSKIPELPFALIIDKYRWDIFSGKIKPQFYNEAYWEWTKSIRGLKPPEYRNETFFDAGAKFHIPDNTPYVRYFLSGILQMDMFKALCELSLYGKNMNNNDEQDIRIKLHRCDIYGSRRAGKKLEKMMQKGASQHWSETLKILTGRKYITTKPLLDFYKPLYVWLKNYVNMYNLPVGW